MNTPQDTLTRIASQAEEVRKAAQAITERIVLLEKYLASIPGRTECSIGLPDASIFFSRKGKAWRLEYTHADSQDCRFLEDAPLKVKLEALKSASMFIYAIENGQAALLKKLQDTAATFDAVYMELPGVVVKPVEHIYGQMPDLTPEIVSKGKTITPNKNT